MNKVNNKKEIWRKNFYIQKTPFHYIVSSLVDVMDYQHLPTGYKPLKKMVMIQEDYELVGGYFLKDELREHIETIIKFVFKYPKKVDQLHKRIRQYFFAYFKSAQAALKIDVKKISDGELAKIYNKIVRAMMLAHGPAISTTWFIDADGEDFSRFLLERLDKIIKKQKAKIDLTMAFSILTTPEKPSMDIKEELNSLRIFKEIKKDKTARRIFSQRDADKISQDLIKINDKLRRKIFNHFKKWRWTPFIYLGPAYELDYYLEVWSGLLRQKFNVSGRIKELENYTAGVRKSKRAITAKIKLSPEDKRLFALAAEIIYLKAYRKDYTFFGMYVLDRVVREIARRLNLSKKQADFIAFWEVDEALHKRKFSVDVLNDRIKYSVFYINGKNKYIYTGAKARKFIAGLGFEKEKQEQVDSLAGTSAYPGKARGKVKIINLPEETGKMKAGDIMVSHTTFPALAPAMKKAAAIITDDGGITCHAAIVARELKTPCVVGTKIATSVLTDGDRVEVDADEGIVKRVRSKK